MLSKYLKSTIKTGQLENLKYKNYPSSVFNFGQKKRELSHKLYSVKVYMLRHFTEKH